MYNYFTTYIFALEMTNGSLYYHYYNFYNDNY